MKLKEVTYAQAINEAIREEMTRDKSVILMGEDVGVFGGVYKVTKGLLEAFGPERVMDTPISEDGFVGTAIGAAATGLKPIVEIMYLDFILCCMNQLVNHAAKLRYMTGGALSVPLVIRTAIIQGRNSGADHSQAFMPIFMHIPGLILAAPSTPHDAKGLLKTAIRGSSPTLFFEYAPLYGLKETIPEEEFLIPFGKAETRRKGSDITIVGASAAVHKALSAAKRLDESGISAEVIDLRTLMPLDVETLLASVRKTGRLLVVENSWKTCGIGAEIASQVIENSFHFLKAPILRVGTEPVPEPVSPPLAKLLLLSEDKIVEAAETIFRYGE